MGKMLSSTLTFSAVVISKGILKLVKSSIKSLKLILLASVLFKSPNLLNWDSSVLVCCHLILNENYVYVMMGYFFYSARH